MSEHYTKSTVEVRAYCRGCSAFTMHRVDAGRKGSCQACIKRLDDEAAKPKPAPAAKQESLF